MKVDNRATRIFCNITLVGYVVFLVWAILLKFNDEYMVRGVQEVFYHYSMKERFYFNLVPFSHGNYVTKDTILNFAIFVPYGLVLPHVVGKKRWWLAFIIPILTTLVFEFLQLVAPLGSLSMDDVVCNSLGGIVGVALGLLTFKLSEKELKNCFIISVCICSVVALFAITSTLINIDLYFTR